MDVVHNVLHTILPAGIPGVQDQEVRIVESVDAAVDGSKRILMQVYLSFFVGVSLVLFFRFKKDRGFGQPVGGYRKLEEEGDKYWEVRSVQIR